MRDSLEERISKNMERTFEYIGFRGRICDIVKIGIDWFDYRDNEINLPKVGAFCRKCSKETAKPMMPIYMNGKPAYVLHCNKCGSEYPMYKSMFVQRYVGYDLACGGHVNPTHGTKSIVASMDRKAKDHYNNREKCVEARMCEMMNCSPEEYRERKKKWTEENKKLERKFEREQAARHAEYEDEKRKEESIKRRELIDKGIIKYIKNVGLVNTETGEVVKL